MSTYHIKYLRYKLLHIDYISGVLNKPSVINIKKIFANYV